MFMSGTVIKIEAEIMQISTLTNSQIKYLCFEWEFQLL